MTSDNHQAPHPRRQRQAGVEVVPGAGRYRRVAFHRHLHRRANMDNAAPGCRGKPDEEAGLRMEEPPSLVITDPAEVIVDVPREVKRFRVAIKTGSQGLILKCSDAASRRIRRECQKAGDDSWHEFDYGTQEAIIFVPSESRPLPEYIAGKKE